MGVELNRYNTFQANCGHYIKRDTKYAQVGDKSYCIDCDPRRITIKTPTGIIKRIPRIVQCGNFMQMWILYKNKEYLVGDGDEYLHGMPKVFELGKCF